MRAEGRSGEAVHVEAEEPCQIARVGVVVKVAARRNVGAHAPGSRYAIDIGCSDLVGKSLLECGDAGQLPAANRLIGSPVDARGKFPAAANRQLVDITGHKPEGYVEVRATVVQIRSGVIHEALVAGLAGACSGRRRLVIEALGPGKYRRHGQVAGAMLKLHVTGVVVRVTVEVAVDIGTVEVGIRQAAHD